MLIYHVSILSASKYVEGGSITNTSFFSTTKGEYLKKQIRRLRLPCLDKSKVVGLIA